MIHQIKNLFFLTSTSSHFLSQWSLFLNTLSNNCLGFFDFHGSLNLYNFSLNLNRGLYLFNFSFDFNRSLYLFNFNLGNNYFFCFNDIFESMESVFIAMVLMTSTNTLTNTIFIVSFFNNIFFDLNNWSFLNNFFNIIRVFIQHYFFLDDNLFLSVSEFFLKESNLSMEMIVVRFLLDSRFFNEIHFYFINKCFLFIDQVEQLLFFRIEFDNLLSH